MSQNDPQWGGGRKDGPPDLDEIIRNFTNKLSRFFGGGNRPPSSGSGRGIPGGSTGIFAIIGVVIVLWLASGFYVVDERENALILRFGRYVETVNKSGLKWHYPWPIETREIINVTEIRSLEVGGRTDGGGDESIMLTGDQNIIQVQLEVQYTLKSAQDFAFDNRFVDRDGKDMVKQAAETAIREVIGQNKVDYVLNEGRGKIAEDTRELIQNLLDRYGTGIAVARVNISDVQPPEQVQAAFADAVKARQDRARLINEGTAYANDVIPKASGTAARLMEEAQGYKQRVVSQADGDASRFKQVATEYAKAPQVTRERMYLDTMQQMFQNTTKILVDQKGSGNLLYLPLDKLIQSTNPGPTVDAAKAATAADNTADATPATAAATPAASDRGVRDGR
ncbi:MULTISPECIES: FtsH protease activity modulator HflK [Silvimonas]|uniref:FtsH protease activity modulator HflK n=1 Tax=Silvimonas TaxID=300264 RepID=UPI0024B35AE2|nr:MULTISPECIES: FtsH protease activity modulator HflK [Silvimonas]MDR3428570.1 FtsH protease activity modulator HflK [Silvimonas sp.]